MIKEVSSKKYLHKNKRHYRSYVAVDYSLNLKQARKLIPVLRDYGHRQSLCVRAVKLTGHGWLYTVYFCYWKTL